MYLNGEGVPPSDVEAYFWFSLAKAQEPALAKKYLKRLEDKMSDKEIARAEELLANWRLN